MRAGAALREEWVHAAWAALVSGRPGELRALEALLEQSAGVAPVATEAEARRMRASLRRLELLLGATERNLRILRGQCGM